VKEIDVHEDGKTPRLKASWRTAIGIHLDRSAIAGPKRGENSPEKSKRRDFLCPWAQRKGGTRKGEREIRWKSDVGGVFLENRGSGGRRP